MFKKIQPNPFLIIEKVTSNFQTLQEYAIDSQLQNEGCFVPQVVAKWIRWIPPINGNFKLNLDGSRVENRSASGWVIRNSNCIIKMATSRHMSNASIIIAKCMTFRDSVLAAENNGLLNLEIEGDSKVVIDSYNKKSNIPSFIMLLMKDIWKIT